MGTLIVRPGGMLWVVLVALVAWGAVPNQTADRFVDPFANDPQRSGGRLYDEYWRPVIVPDRAKIQQIQGRLAELSPADASRQDLVGLFGREPSAFLYPILASDGQRGLILLRRVLAEYGGAKALDNRWLLVVACLGRMGTPEAEAALLAELKRLQTEYRWVPQGSKLAVPRGPTSHYFGLWPLVDAVLACRVKQGVLTAASVEWLLDAPQLADSQFFAWVAAVQWMQQCSTREVAAHFVWEALATCADEDFATYLAGRPGYSRKLRGLATALGAEKDRAVLQELARLALSQPRARQAAVALKRYLAGLMNQAVERGDGSIAVDCNLARGLSTQTVLPRTSAVSRVVHILAACRLEEPCEGWDVFVQKYRDDLSAFDEEFVQYMVRRARGQEPPFVGGPSETRGGRGRHRGPGIYFRGIRGVMPMR